MRNLLKKTCIWIFLIILLSGFVEHSSQTDSARKYESIASGLRKNVALQLKREKNLHPCGFGGGMMNKVNTLYLGFIYYQPLDIDEARNLIIYAGNLFLKTINDNERIRPDLVNYPFQPKNIEIDFFFRNPDGSYLDEGKLRVISLVDGVIKYNIRKPGYKYLETIHRETFEEAAAKVKAENLQ